MDKLEESPIQEVPAGSPAPSTPPPAWADEQHSSADLLRDGPAPIHTEDIEEDPDVEVDLDVHESVQAEENQRLVAHVCQG